MTTSERFLSGYVACALWSSPSNKDPNTGEPMLDRDYGRGDLAPEALKSMTDDCEAFQRDNAADLALAYVGAYSPERAGHDFWLTRNRHGAGFWDRGLGLLGDRLTEAAHAYGEVNLYLALADGSLREMIHAE